MDSFNQYVCGQIGWAYYCKILHSRIITFELLPLEVTSILKIINENDEEDGGHEQYIALCQGDTPPDYGYSDCIFNDSDVDNGN